MSAINSSFLTHVFSSTFLLVWCLIAQWPQWRALLIHVITIPAALVFSASRARVPVTLVIVATLFTTFVDVWLAGSFACFLWRCCPPGESTAAMSMGMPVCDEDHRVDVRVLSMTALLVCAAEAVQGGRRAEAVYRAAGGEGVLAGVSVYGAAKLFAMSWAAVFHAAYYVQTGLTVGGAAAVAVFVGIGVGKNWALACGLAGCAASDAAVALAAVWSKYPWPADRSMPDMPGALAAVAIWHVATTALAVSVAHELAFPPKQS